MRGMEAPDRILPTPSNEGWAAEQMQGLRTPGRSPALPGEQDPLLRLREDTKPESATEAETTGVCSSGKTSQPRKEQSQAEDEASHPGGHPSTPTLPGLRQPEKPGTPRGLQQASGSPLDVLPVPQGDSSRADCDRFLIVLTLRPLPDQAHWSVRLRRLLKTALRAFRFRCIDIRREPDEQ